MHVVFAGHAHCYDRFLQDGVHYVVTGGAGALPHDCEARDLPDDYVRLAVESVFHFVFGELSKDTATFEAIAAEDGRVIDSFRVVRQDGG